MKLVSTLLILAAAMLMGGCSSTVNTVEVNEGGAYNWIQTDRDLTSVASLSGVRKARADGLLRVQVDITNRKSSRQVIQYRFVWLDANGMVVHTPLTTWQRHFLEGKQTSALQGVAPNGDVTDCKLEMKRAEAM